MSAQISQEVVGKLSNTRIGTGTVERRVTQGEGGRDGTGEGRYR
jgi:hypothetical protein